MTNQSSALNTIKVQESANYLADLFMEIENEGKADDVLLGGSRLHSDGRNLTQVA